MHRSKIAMHPVGVISDQDAFLECSRNITVDSEPSASPSHRFRKQQERSNPKGRDILILKKNSFFLYSFSDKLSHYTTYVFRKLFIPDTFKQVC